MKHAVQFFTRPDPGLLLDLAAELRARRLFPESLHADRHGPEVRIRMVLECGEEDARQLRRFCETVLNVREVLVTAAP